MHRLAAAALTALLFATTSPPAAAQEVPPTQDEPSIAGEEHDRDATPVAETLPTHPEDRLLMAQAAFRRAEYGLLAPLLEPICGADSPLGSVDARVQARELLVVGYFFLAQRATSAPERDALLADAAATALNLLRERPDHTLDTLVFPVSVVDLFESVRRDNAEELEALRAQQDTDNGAAQAQTVYVERAVTAHRGWVNFLPFGAGQFQNGHLVKGTTFAFLQGASLAVNAASYWMILRLRDPQDGLYSAEGGLTSDFAAAKRWRQALYGGLIGFVATWALSAVDGWLNFEAETVRIRTLDAPPPELGGPRPSVGAGLPLGLSLEFRW